MCVGGLLASTSGRPFLGLVEKGKRGGEVKKSETGRCEREKSGTHSEVAEWEKRKVGSCKASCGSRAEILERRCKSRELVKKDEWENHIDQGP